MTTQAEDKGKGRLGAFIMTFRRGEILADTIQRLKAQTRPADTILIVDNDPDQSARTIAEEAGVDYLAIGRNTGPAGAAFAGLSCLQHTCEFVFWADDDDPPRQDDAFEVLVRALERHPDAGAAAGRGLRWNAEQGRPERIPDQQLRGIVSVDVVGGCDFLMLRSSSIRKAGLPRVDLFWGSEDYDYCLQLKRAGFDIIVDADAFSTAQRKGRKPHDASSKWASRLRKWTWRDYYAARNNIALASTRTTPLGQIRTHNRILLSLAGGLVSGSSSDRLQTLWLAYRAVSDAHRGRMGMTIDPLAASNGSLLRDPRKG